LFQLEQRDDWTEQSDESSGSQGSSEGVHDSAFARGQAGGQASADANDDGQDKQFHGLKRWIVLLIICLDWWCECIEWFVAGRLSESAQKELVESFVTVLIGFWVGCYGRPWNGQFRFCSHQAFWLMEIILAGCLIFPVAALWLQSNEDEDDEENFDFLWRVRCSVIGRCFHRWHSVSADLHLQQRLMDPWAKSEKLCPMLSVKKHW
jgi:hypothetical protein